MKATIALLEKLRFSAAKDENLFRRQLALEDARRVKKLVDMAKSGMSRDQYMKNGLFIGWTQGDMTTHRIQDEIKMLMATIFNACSLQGGDDDNAEIDKAWAGFVDARLKRLIHCL